MADASGPDVAPEPTSDLAAVTPRKSRPYHGHVHRLRGIAILGIVSTHVIPVLGIPFSGLTRSFFEVLLGGGSAVFLMISGFLFRETMTPYSYGTFLGRKFRNIVCPYLIMSMPALALYVGGLKHSHPWLPDGFFDLNPVAQVVVLLGTGAHLGPYWFIPVILLFFLVSPVFVFIERHPRLYAILPVLMVVTVLVPRPDEDSNPLIAFLHFGSVFLLGMYVSRRHEPLMAIYARHRALVLGGAAGLTMALIIASDWLAPVGTLARVAAGIFFLLLLRTRPNMGRAGSLLDRLGEASFAVFFLHGYPVAAFRALIPDDIDWNIGLWLLAWATMTLAVAAVSAAIAFGIRRVLGKRSRYVIGM